MTTDLASRIADLATFIDDRTVEDEEAARAWQSPPWGEDATSWKVAGQREPRYYNGRSETLTVIDVSGRPVNFAEAIQVRWDSNGERAVHIARHDPARALRRVKATRELVAAILAEEHADAERDSLRSCSQVTSPDSGKPCDCGRDQRVARMLGIIASEWQETP